jgi:hypothetical protein
MRRSSVPFIAFITSSMFVLLLASTASAQVVRCEGADGRITYTNEPCPSTARRTRTIDDSPPVQAQRADRPADKAAVAKTDEAPAKPDGGEVAKSEPAKPEAAKDTAKDAAKDVSKDASKDTAKDAKPALANAAIATPSQIRTATAPSDLTPAQQMEQLDLERARQQRACTQLERRLSFARSDVDAASGGQRASAELQLRRLQEDFRAQCPLQR